MLSRYGFWAFECSNSALIVRMDHLWLYVQYRHWRDIVYNVYIDNVNIDIVAACVSVLSFCVPQSAYLFQFVLVCVNIDVWWLVYYKCSYRKLLWHWRMFAKNYIGQVFCFRVRKSYRNRVYTLYTQRSVRAWTWRTFIALLCSGVQTKQKRDCTLTYLELNHQHFITINNNQVNITKT